MTGYISPFASLCLCNLGLGLDADRETLHVSQACHLGVGDIRGGKNEAGLDNGDI